MGILWTEWYFSLDATRRETHGERADASTPALLMAAATVNIPAISMNVGPMLNGEYT